MGLDGVSGWALKECKAQILDPIWEMVTTPLKEKRESTTRMKESQYNPNIKGGKSTGPSNYIPVNKRTGEQRWMDGHGIPGHKKKERVNEDQYGTI
ncbi:hypothetical protein E2C01_044667 [Portunus trituberculatus]|uniref:Uncharacterized protein n=1 Tax=Portunus trituberculatus TaxID=210409 RepID=A0A5B7G2X9_PORTR|nr:hypothetical protein [Portunus trituberculatus]